MSKLLHNHLPIAQ